MATTKINFYERYATEHLVIDEDSKGLFCEVISETVEGQSYTVRVDESGVVPVATSCNCPAHKPCKHIALVNTFYAKVYKSNVEKQEVKAAEVAEQNDETTAQVQGAATKGIETATLSSAAVIPGWASILPSRNKPKVA